MKGAMKTIPSVANLSDAMTQLGLKFQTLHSRIRPVFTPIGLFGPAYTVHCYPGATWAAEEAIEKAKPGEVLVINGENYAGAVLMGELMSGRAKKRGLAGTVIDGAVRDTVSLRKASWPMFASHVTPRAGTFDKLGQQQIAISCGEVVVHPGDFIAGDDDGVVVIPRARLDAVLAKAREIERKERFIARAIRKGLSLAQSGAAYGKRQ
jgi:4-hydroxy-4-methyl-2-oxoglutarate aldolase